MELQAHIEKARAFRWPVFLALCLVPLLGGCGGAPLTLGTLVEQLLIGIILGSIYALIALGYTLVYGVIKLINFAHGDIYMLGAFGGYYCLRFTIRWLHFEHGTSLILCFVISLLVSAIACALIAMLMERLAYRPLRRSTRIAALITAVGVSFLLENSGIIVFGPNPKSYEPKTLAVYQLELSSSSDFANAQRIEVFDREQEQFAASRFAATTYARVRGVTRLGEAPWSPVLNIEPQKPGGFVEEQPSVPESSAPESAVSEADFTEAAGDLDAPEAIDADGGLDPALQPESPVPVPPAVVTTTPNSTTRTASMGYTRKQEGGREVVVISWAQAQPGEIQLMPVFSNARGEMIGYNLPFTTASGALVRLPLFNIVIVAATLLLLAGLNLLINRSRFGISMRALSFDMNAAKLMGVNTDRVISITFAIGGACAAVAGNMVGLYNQSIEPLMGILPGIKAFVAAVVGGIGSIPGAVAGGLIMGLSESLVKGNISPQWSALADALAFAILIVVLLFKPSGLLGRSVREKV